MQLCYKTYFEGSGCRWVRAALDAASNTNYICGSKKTETAASQTKC